jgi:hypothetical protein
MRCLTCGKTVEAQPSGEVDRLEALVLSRLGRQVHDLRVLVRDPGESDRGGEGNGAAAGGLERVPRLRFGLV